MTFSSATNADAPALLILQDAVSIATDDST
jgi:hypothetical protein